MANPLHTRCVFGSFSRETSILWFLTYNKRTYNKCTCHKHKCDPHTYNIAQYLPQSNHCCKQHKTAYTCMHAITHTLKHVHYIQHTHFLRHTHIYMETHIIVEMSAVLISMVREWDSEKCRCTHTCIHTQTQTNTHAHAHKQTHTHVHIQTFAHPYTHMHICTALKTHPHTHKSQRHSTNICTPIHSHAQL